MPLRSRDCLRAALLITGIAALAGCVSQHPAGQVDARTESAGDHAPAASTSPESAPAAPAATHTVMATADMVEIHTTNDADMFPPEWLRPPNNTRTSDLAREEVNRSRLIVSRAICKYPAIVMKQNLKRAYVVGGLHFRDIDAVGTNSLAFVYITNAGASIDSNECFIEGRFHHELSSILMRNHPGLFPLEKWKAANPVGFKYIGDGVLAKKAGKASNRGTAELIEQGFLVDYSQASVEEDFNVIAQLLFTNAEWMWAWAPLSPRLNAKIELAIQFYHALDPMFTKEYFQSLPRCAN